MPKINVTNFADFGMCSCCRRTTASYYNSVSALAQAGSTAQGTNVHSHVWQLDFFRVSDGDRPPNYTPTTRIFPGQQGLYEFNYANIDQEWNGVVLPPYVDLEEDVLSECDLVCCNHYDLGTLPRGWTRDSFPVPQSHRNPLAAWLINGGILCIHMLDYSGDPDDYTATDPLTGISSTWRDADLYSRTNGFIRFLGGNMSIVPSQLSRGPMTFNPSLPLTLGCPSEYGVFGYAPVTGGIPVAYRNNTPIVAIERIGDGWLMVAGCHAELPVPLYKNFLEDRII